MHCSTEVAAAVLALTFALGGACGGVAATAAGARRARERRAARRAREQRIAAQGSALSGITEQLRQINAQLRERDESGAAGGAEELAGPAATERVPDAVTSGASEGVRKDADGTSSNEDDRGPPEGKGRASR